MHDTTLVEVEVWSNQHAIRLRDRALHKVLFRGEEIGSFTTTALGGYTCRVQTRQARYTVSPTHVMSNSYSLFEGRREIYRLIPKGFFSAYIVGRGGLRYKLKLAGLLDWTVLLLDLNNREIILEHRGSAISESKKVLVAPRLLEDGTAVPLIALIYHYRQQLRV